MNEPDCLYPNYRHTPEQDSAESVKCIKLTTIFQVQRPCSLHEEE